MSITIDPDAVKDLKLLAVAATALAHKLERSEDRARLLHCCGVGFEIARSAEADNRARGILK